MVARSGNRATARAVTPRWDTVSSSCASCDTVSDRVTRATEGLTRATVSQAGGAMGPLRSGGNQRTDCTLFYSGEEEIFSTAGAKIVKANVLILGASYGSLFGTKLLLAGHRVALVCTRPTAELINREGTLVRFPIKGRQAP